MSPHADHAVTGVVSRGGTIGATNDAGSEDVGLSGPRIRDFLTFFIAERILLLIVPSGYPVEDAISVWLISFRKAISSNSRCSQSRQLTSFSQVKRRSESASRSKGDARIESSHGSEHCFRKRLIDRFRDATKNHPCNVSPVTATCEGLHQSCMKISCTTSSAEFAFCST